MQVMWTWIFTVKKVYFISTSSYKPTNMINRLGNGGSVFCNILWLKIQNKQNIFTGGYFMVQL